MSTHEIGWGITAGYAGKNEDFDMFNKTKLLAVAALALSLLVGGPASATGKPQPKPVSQINVTQKTQVHQGQQQMQGQHQSQTSNSSVGDMLFLSGSISAAECAEAINIFGLGASRTDRVCRAVLSQQAFCEAGYLTPGECRAIALRVMEWQGLRFAKRPGDIARPGVASDDIFANGDGKSPTKRSPLNFVAPSWNQLSAAQQRQVHACEAQWNGKWKVGCQTASKHAPRAMNTRSSAPVALGNAMR